MTTPTDDHGLAAVRSELTRLFEAGDKDGLIDAVCALLSATLGQANQLAARVAELQRQLYGQKKERISPLQLALALLEQDAANSTAAAPEEPAVPTPPVEAVPRLRQKAKRGRKPLPAHLPREEIRLQPTEAQLATTAGNMKPMGEERSEVLEYEPARFKVLVYVREVWSNDVGEIVTAPAPAKVIDKGLPGPGLLTQVVIAKYRDHCPLARQVGIYRRSGVELSRNTLVDWVAAAAYLVEPVARRIFERAMASHVLQVDDTSLQVLDRRKAKHIKRGHIWALVGDHFHVAYRYTEDWRADSVMAFLAERRGWMQVDGYKGYEQVFDLRRAVEVGCWMHARRYFVRAFERKDLRAAHALALIREMYRVEAESKEAEESPAARLVRRQRETAPRIEALRVWIADLHGREPPSSPLGKALTYADNHWTALCRPLEDGALELDNGDCERALRGTAMGRRNWLFAGSDEGATRAAILATVIETAVRHGLDVWRYFHDILVKLASGWPQRRLGELLPDQWRVLHAA